MCLALKPLKLSCKLGQRWGNIIRQLSMRKNGVHYGKSNLLNMEIITFSFSLSLPCAVTGFIGLPVDREWDHSMWTEIKQTKEQKNKNNNKRKNKAKNNVRVQPQKLKRLAWIKLSVRLAYHQPTTGSVSHFREREPDIPNMDIIVKTARLWIYLGKGVEEYDVKHAPIIFNLSSW